MYGPSAAPPPPPQRHGSTGLDRGDQGKRITLRLLFASFPVWSLGLLAWVPALRFALLRRRPMDWAVFAVAAVLTIFYVALLIAIPEDDDGPASVFAGLYIIVLIVGAVVHAFLGDLAPYPVRAPLHGPRPGGYPTPPAGGYGYPGARPAGPADPYAATHAAPPPYTGGPAPHPGTATTHHGPVPGPGGPGQAGGPGAPGAPGGSARMRQVASELDELDELLRKQKGDR